MTNRKFSSFVFYFIAYFRLKLFITLDSSGPTLALDSTSESCRSAFAKIRSEKITLVLPQYTPAELLSTGLCNG